MGRKFWTARRGRYAVRIDAKPAPGPGQGGRVAQGYDLRAIGQ
jgi:hypothetical protein